MSEIYLQTVIMILTSVSVLNYLARLNLEKRVEELEKNDKHN